MDTTAKQAKLEKIRGQIQKLNERHPKSEEAYYKHIAKLEALEEQAIELMDELGLLEGAE
ncbi:MAG: hypothetical protein ACKOX6_12115 [Bdellovibrio sp.]